MSFDVSNGAAKIARWTRYGSLTVFVPGWNYKAAVPLLKYCLSLIIFTVFGTIAEKLRPIILGIRVPSEAGTALSDYQIINNVRIFLTMISSSFIVALIPHLSGTAAVGSESIYKRTIVDGTKYFWTVGALLGFGIIMLSKDLLHIYVGKNNLYLNLWLIIIVIGTMYNLYITPIISVILSSGRLIPMIYATAIACAASLIVCWIVSPQYGVGGIACSLIAYNLVHFLITHYWYLPRCFQINPSQQIAKIFFPPLISGIAMYFIVGKVMSILNFGNNYLDIFFGAVFGTVIYLTIIIGTFIRPGEIKQLYLRISR